jgi:ABC-2 type transport system permease protein
MLKLITIAQNTLTETLRQPIYAIIIAAAILLFIISPALTMYTMSDDDKLLREIGLSTLFLTSLFIAIFSASGAVAEELEKKTITTVLSKPVQRPVFIVAKFLGVASAVILAHYICTIALLMTIRHGVLESASDTRDWTVIATAGASLSLAILLSVFFSYMFGWKFSATFVVLTGIFATAGIAFLGFIDPHWTFNPSENGLHALDIYGALLLLFAALVMTALAIAFSSRFNIVVTLSACVGLFLLGLISDYVFGRFADTYLWAKMAWFMLPNLQVFWISDAIYEESQVPGRYIMIAGSYALCYVGAILAFSVGLFQRRQVG